VKCHYSPVVGELRWRGQEPYSPDLDFDHYIPRHRGGLDEADNIVMACWRCDHAKGWYWSGPDFETLVAAMGYEVLDNDFQRWRFMDAYRRRLATDRIPHRENGENSPTAPGDLPPWP
jgi:hypothetical protein